MVLCGPSKAAAETDEGAVRKGRRGGGRRVTSMPGEAYCFIIAGLHPPYFASVDIHLTLWFVNWQQSSMLPS